MQRLLERSVDELEDLQVRGIFSREEIRKIVRMRTDFEYRLQARAPDKLDFLRYIKYEYNLDQLRRKRRRRIAGDSAGGAAMSDFAGERRIHFIFSRALKKFQGDLPLWNQYIDFAMRGKSHGRLSKIFPEALRLHPKCADLWIKGAVWEYRHNQNIATARTYMQRAIRLNAAAHSLWVEYFRLELDYVRRVRARRSVLGLSVDSGDTVASNEQAIEEAQRGEEDTGVTSDGSDDRDSGDDSGGSGDADSKATTAEVKAKAQDDNDAMAELARNASSSFLKGAVPFIVYTNACKSNPDGDVDFHMQFLSACGRDFPWLLDRILVRCKHHFGQSNVQFWDTYARLPETLLDDNLSDLNTYRTNGGLEINIGDNDDADEVGRSSDGDVEEIAEQEVERRFRQALEAMPAPEMWTKYLVWLAEGVEEEEDDASKLNRRLRLNNGFKSAHQQKCLEPELYRDWVRLVMMYFSSEDGDTSSTPKKRRRGATQDAQADNSGAMLAPWAIACAATHAHPQSVVAWKVRLNLARHLLATQGSKGGASSPGTKRKASNYSGTSDDQEVTSFQGLVELIEEGCSSVDVSIDDAWEIESMLIEVWHTIKGVGSKLYRRTKKSILRMRERHYSPEASLAFLQKFSEIVCGDEEGNKIFFKVMDFVIDSSRAFRCSVPVAVFKMTIQRAVEQISLTTSEDMAGRFKSRVRALFQKYLAVHPQNLSAWLDCARFEVAHGKDAKTLADLNWRACGALGKASNWEAEFAKIRLLAQVN